MIERTESSKLTSWFYEIDRRLLWAVCILIFVGVFAALSAGSVSAARIGEPWYYFIKKALVFYPVGIFALFGASTLSKKWVIGISALNVAVGLFLLCITFLSPHIINGSARWVSWPINMMPADILKPGFIIMTAWFLAKMKSVYGREIFLNQNAWKWRWPNWWAYLGLFGFAFLIILNHPDFGTALLYAGVLLAMLFVADMSWKLIGILAAVGIPGIATYAFFKFAHVRDRLTGTADSYQSVQSIQSIQHGGLLGSGDDAFVKQSLPDAHTDYVFSAFAEDVGAIIAIALIFVMIYILKRLTTNAIGARDRFVFYALSGTVALFGLQICINLQAALGLFPKGMTLPFISYGGSSFVAFCLLFGMVLALIREDKWK